MIEKNLKKKELDGTAELIGWAWLGLEVTGAGWVGGLTEVGGRVREGNPPRFGLTLGHDPETPATGAAD